jgi:hypothetical protein
VLLTVDKDVDLCRLVVVSPIGGEVLEAPVVRVGAGVTERGGTSA